MKKYSDSVQGEQRDEYDDLLRKIQKLAKKVVEDVEEQGGRLDAFEEKLLDTSGGSQHVADADMLFLKKEVARYRAAISACRGMTNELLDDSVRIKDNGQKQPDGLLSLEDLQSLRANLKGLQKQDGTDVPRITRNIDQLEGFSLKSLKNQLNEDNKIYGLGRKIKL